MWLMLGHSATGVAVSCSCLVLVSAHLLYFKSFLSHDRSVSCAVEICSLLITDNIGIKVNV